MPRLARADIFASADIAIVHVACRTVRRCFLMGYDKISRKNNDHRKLWIEQQLANQAQFFAIDICSFAIMDNHIHQQLRARPDIVQQMDDAEVARRWLMLCPARRGKNRQPLEPTEFEMNRVVNDKKRVEELRRRLSDISWWMRLLCQHIAQRANREDEEVGKFWQARYKAVKNLDDTAILACAAYIDLNPIRAGLADSIDNSVFTSANRRAKGQKTRKQRHVADRNSGVEGTNETTDSTLPDSTVLNCEHLAPVNLCENSAKPGSQVHTRGTRCSDKGFLPITLSEYLELLDWSAQQQPGKKSVPVTGTVDRVLAELKISADAWCELIRDFGRLFSSVAGKPHVIDAYRSPTKSQSFRPRPRVRELLTNS